LQARFTAAPVFPASRPSAAGDLRESESPVLISGIFAIKVQLIFPMQQPFDRKVEIPALETERLRLRGHCPEDFADCTALWGDPEVTRYIGGKPLSAEEVWARMLRYAGHWNWMKYGYWVMEEKSSGKFAGEVGFADYQRELDPPIAGMPEIGWALGSSFQGQGYATEAVRAVVAWGDAQFETDRTVCLIRPENIASIRVAEKCGYRIVGRPAYKGHTTLLFGRDRPGVRD
jgi:RimJ/RimL family protein N-acetyltransferase